MTNNIPCIFIERKWMRAAKAWRCVIELPDDSVLAAAITSLIDRKVIVSFVTKDATLTIDPAFIVDVPSKGKRFYLVVETVFEHQASHGPVLTAMTGQTVSVTIRPEDSQAPVEVKRGTISEHAIKGLHSVFFKHPKFQELIAAKSGAYIKNEQDCKTEFKKIMGVSSCTEVDQEAFDALKKEFEDRINGAKSV